MVNKANDLIEHTTVRNDRTSSGDQPSGSPSANRVRARLKHDEAYKKLFKRKEFMAGLLAGHVQGDWVEDLDLDSLEEAPTEKIGKLLKRRLNDLAWRVQLRGEEEGWLDICLVLELQSSVDREMALRTLVYSGVGYEGQSDAREGGDDPFAPMVFVVLHTGSRPWTAKRDMIELIQPAPKKIQHLLPRISYELVEERIAPAPERAKEGNPAEAVFAIGRSTGREEMLRAARTALRSLAGRPDLLRLVMVWMDGYYLKRHFPNREFERKETMAELQEMLEDEFEDFDELARAEIRVEVRAEVRQEVQAEVRQEVQAEVRQEVRAEARAEILDAFRANTVQLVGDRFGDRAACRAEVRLAGITRLEPLMDAHRWVAVSQSESALLDRLAAI